MNQKQQFLKSFNQALTQGGSTLDEYERFVDMLSARRKVEEYEQSKARLEPRLATLTYDDISLSFDPCPCGSKQHLAFEIEREVVCPVALALKLERLHLNNIVTKLDPLTVLELCILD